MNFKILKDDVLYRGFTEVHLCDLKIEKFSGEISPPFKREITKRLNSVAILPYDPVCEKIILVEQFRCGTIYEKEAAHFLLEIVAGVTDKDLSPTEIAKAELFEEAGLTAKKLIPITEYWNSPGGSTEYTYLFCAVIDSTKAGGIHGLTSENEDIKTHILSTSEVFNFLENKSIISERMNNASTLIALQWLLLNHDKKQLFQ